MLRNRLYIKLIVPASVVALGLMIISFKADHSSWLSGLTLNLASTFVGIPVTLLLVDYIIQRHERQSWNKAWFIADREVDLIALDVLDAILEFNEFEDRNGVMRDFREKASYKFYRDSAKIWSYEIVKCFDRFMVQVIEEMVATNLATQIQNSYESAVIGGYAEKVDMRKEEMTAIFGTQAARDIIERGANPINIEKIQKINENMKSIMNSTNMVMDSKKDIMNPSTVVEFAVFQDNICRYGSENNVFQGLWSARTNDIGDVFVSARKMMMRNRE